MREAPDRRQLTTASGRRRSSRDHHARCTTRSSERYEAATFAALLEQAHGRFAPLRMQASARPCDGRCASSHAASPQVGAQRGRPQLSLRVLSKAYPRQRGEREAAEITNARISY